jgi:Bacteriophage head to tail connecting protein.
VLPTGGRIRLLGTENAQALRGLYLDDLVLDEPADMPRQVWTQVLRPMLADRQGRALFCGTPQGTDNLLYDVWQQAGADTQGLWSRFRFPASETGYLPASELAAARRGMESVQDQIRKGLYNDLFKLILDGRSGVTASEIAAREEEKLILVGPVLERLHDELFIPLMDRTFECMPQHLRQKAVWYANADVLTALELQNSDAGNVQLQYGEFFDSKAVPVLHGKHATLTQ